MGESEGMQTRRHAPLGRQRAHFVQSAPGRRRHTDLHRGRSRLADILTRDHSDARRSGHFRWLLSTSLAAAVGLIAIAAIVAGSGDTQQNGLPRSPFSRVDGLPWAIPKTDKLLIPGGVVAARFDIPDVVRQRRDKRDYIVEKTYLPAGGAPCADLEGAGRGHPASRSHRALRQHHAPRSDTTCGGRSAERRGQGCPAVERHRCQARMAKSSTCGRWWTWWRACWTSASTSRRCTSGRRASPLASFSSRGHREPLSSFPSRIHRSWRNRCSRPMTPRKMRLRSVPRVSTRACTTPPSVWTFRLRSSCRFSGSTPIRRTSAKACAQAMRSSFSSTGRRRQRWRRTARRAACYRYHLGQGNPQILSLPYAGRDGRLL